MGYILAGLLLWSGAHFFKRLLPDLRAKMGKAGRPVVAVSILIGIALMIIGYRAAEEEYIYALPADLAWTLNNILMFVALVLMDAGRVEGVIRSVIRHPMLSGVAVWAFAHLLVNGDKASLLLFGGLGLWALLQMALINRAEGPWQRPARGTIAKDMKIVGVASVLYIVIVGIHIWLDKIPLLWW